jgi:hypothetical protein
MYLISDRDRSEMLSYLALLSDLTPSNRDNTKAADLRRRIGLLKQKLESRKQVKSK